MKNILFRYRSIVTLVTLIVGGISFLFSQQPGIPYQAYFIDNSAGYVYGERLENVPLANSKVLLQFDVHDDQNVLEYSERIELSTDKFGLGSTVIRGDGTAVFKSFNDINWNGKSKTLQVYIDFTNSGNNFIKHGQMQIVYIPGPAEDVILGFYSGSGPPTASNPANPVDGSIYVDKTSGEQYAYNSTASTWKSQTDVVSTDAGNILSQDGSGLVYLDTATVVAAEADASPTNELNTSFAVNGTNLELTDAGGTLQVPLASISSDDQNLTASLTGTNLTIAIEDGTDAVVDLSSIDTDTDNQNLSLSGTTLNISGGTGVDLVPAIAAAGEVDGDVTNELNTNFAVNGTNLELTDAGGTLQVPLASLQALTSLVDNNDGTFTYTDEDGGTTILDVKNLETLTTIALNADNTNIDYTDEDGVTTQLDLSNIVANLEALTSLVDNNDGTFTYTDEDGGTTILDAKNLETLTTIALNADNTNIDYTDEDGVTTQLDLSNIVANLEALTSLVDNNDGTFTYTDEDGGTTILDAKNLETLTTIALNADNTNIDYTDEDGVTTQLDLSNIVANLEALTSLVDNNDGTFTYTDEDGGTTILDAKNL